MLGGSRLRPSVLAAREFLASGRQQLREQHSRGLDGARVCARFTSLVDATITQLYEAYLTELPSPDADNLRGRVALVAHGGYGRRQQAPFSDVDLMIVFSGKLDEPIKQFATRLWQDISDANLALGHSLRAPDEAVKLARSDPQIGTSLLESRLMIGTSTVYDRFSSAMRAMVQKYGASLAPAFIAERRKERTEYGETVYLLEPNVKRSRGGLRDIQLLRWLWYIKAGVGDPDRLHDMGVLSKFDYRRLISAQSFLLRVRNEMHFHAGEMCDGLSRLEQLRLAEFLQYRGRQGMLPVEQFMRDYFHHTNHVWQLTHRLSELMQPASRVSQFLEPMLGRRTENDYQIGRYEVSATPRATARLAHHREEVLKLVDLARREGKRISQDTWHFVYLTAPQFSNEPKLALMSQFLQILRNPQRLGALLRRLHGLGVLEKIIPEFSHARSLLQFNQYHKYTVDEHCILAVEEATQFAERDDVVGEIYRGLAEKTTLHLALLIHDLGKGFDEDHSEVGRRIAHSTAERFALPAEQAKTLEFLVHRHLLMSHLGLKYDISQEQLVSRFAEEVGTQERLDMLFVLTCADLAAVGPGVLNSWKIEVLSDFYEATSRRLAAAVAVEEAERDAKRRGVWLALAQSEQKDPWFQRQIDNFPDIYVHRWPADIVINALRRLRTLGARSAAAWARYLPDTDTIEFVAGIDEGSGRGIFSSMAGALTSMKMQILAAETNTLAEGLLLLRYVAHVPEEPGEPPKERLEEICSALVDSIDSNRQPTFPTFRGREEKEAAALLTNLPNDVRINNDLSDTCSIIEVFTVDRRGLLYRLARSLHDLELRICFAKISTYLDQVVDVFYVTEHDGQKPQDDVRLEAIRSALMAAIAIAPAGRKPTLAE
jgi:[protein-PII] uridylyltransferase